MARNADDTVILRPRRQRRAWMPIVAVAILVGAGLGAGYAWNRRASPPAAPGIAMASEAAILAEGPEVRTVLRFNYNPAIVVLDFPTLAEQGRMLNRLAAWAEKAGVPHDRLLNDAELAVAIKAAGVTPDTYYYGHDYRAADVVQFFALADRDHIALDADEQQLRLIVARARAEPFGFGALITLPRADSANAVDAGSRAAILHHELSHGEYFTDAAYAAFVRTVWDSVMSGAERAAFRSYLAEEGYDPALEDLMMNEMQAYLMHTPDRRFFDPDKLGIPTARLAQIRQSFVAGMPSCWLRDVTPRRSTHQSGAPPASPAAIWPSLCRAGIQHDSRSRDAATPPAQVTDGGLKRGHVRRQGL